MNEVRIGKVSSVNAAAGTVRITYADKSDKATAELPVFCGMGEYQMPAVNDTVLVLHLSNDSSIGIVMGRFWSATNPPPQGEAQMYRKSFDAAGAAFLQAAAGRITLFGQELTLSGSAGAITLSELIALKRKVDSLGDD